MFKLSGKQILNWIPALLIMLLILMLSTTGSGQVTDSMGLKDESYHVSGHFLFFAVLYVAYFKATKKLNVSLLLTVLFGVIDELFQLTQPFRSTSLKDVIVDSLAGLFSYVLIWKLSSKLPKILKNWLYN